MAATLERFTCLSPLVLSNECVVLYCERAQRSLEWLRIHLRARQKRCPAWRDLQLGRGNMDQCCVINSWASAHSSLQPPVLSPGCYGVWLSSNLEPCPGRRGFWFLIFLDIWQLVRKLQAACIRPLVNNKWLLTLHSGAVRPRRLTYFSDPVCARISV